MTTRERILDSAHRRVMAGGYAATTIDAVLDDVGVTKGAFFHHFPSKAALGEALVQRYADADIELLDGLLATVREEHADPRARLLALFDRFVELVDADAATQPGCLFVTFVFESVPDAPHIRQIIRRSVEGWRTRIRALLDEVAERYPPRSGVDLDSLADQVFTVFEGGFVLVRATGDAAALRRQLVHLRTYMEVLFS